MKVLLLLAATSLVLGRGGEGGNYGGPQGRANVQVTDITNLNIL